jgi:TldD protein
MKIKNKIISLIILSIFAVNSFAKQKEDIVFKAMNDELKRTMSELKIDDFLKPYFVSYEVTDNENFFVNAKFGGIFKRGDIIKKRKVRVRMRVGNYSFDNMNFEGGFVDSRTLSLPTEDVYDSIRLRLWQVTDYIYKEAIEKYARKKAYKEKKNITQQLDDFLRVKPIKFVDEVAAPEIDTKYWNSLVKEISLVFRKYPKIADSYVSFIMDYNTRRYINSEGTLTKTSDISSIYWVSAHVLTKEGRKIEKTVDLEFRGEENIPKKEEMFKVAENLAKELTEEADSPFAEVYIGPVIFEKYAAGRFFEILFADEIKNPREIWKDDSDATKHFRSPNGKADRGYLVDRFGLRVTSSFIDIVDDPLMQSYDGINLLGSYKVDYEGVMAQKVDLVKKGKLVGLVTGRTPTKYVKESNGHGRYIKDYGNAVPGNLIVSSKKTVTEEELKQKLMDRCKEMDLDYGVIIRTSRFYSDFVAYKVDANTGKETPMHGANVRNVNTRSLRDISLTSDKRYVYNTKVDDIPVSIVTPSILVEEIELDKTKIKPEKPFYIPHPYFSEK